MSPPTQEQRNVRRDSNNRRFNTSNIEVSSDSEASFDSLFDEPESKSKSESDRPSTGKIGNRSRQTKPISSTIIVDRHSTATTTGKRPSERPATVIIAQSGHESAPSDDMLLGKKQRVTTPSPSRFKPITSQRVPNSPAPLAKMVPTHRDLPKLSMPQSNANSTIQCQTPGKTPSTSATLIVTSTKSAQYKLENTKLKVYLHDNKGYKPLLLKDCISPSLFFAKIMEEWSLLDDSIRLLHVTFPWLQNDGRLMILERQNIKAGMMCICDEVESAPCWTGERGCSIDVLIFSNTRAMKSTFDGPTTRDGRSIPDMSVNANRVYWAMRASKQADVGLHAREIATMVGMSPADVVVAGNELLEHCLILTGDEDYDVWSLLEV